VTDDGAGPPFAHQDGGDSLAEQFEEKRGHLRGVAHRMFGSLAEADDAVQEAWLRLSRSGGSNSVAPLLLILETLEPVQRLAFVLHDMFAMPFDEIAEVVGRSTDATRQARQPRPPPHSGVAGAAGRSIRASARS